MTNEEFIKSITVEGEEWKDVIGFEGYYMVSNLGKVISLGRPVTNHLGTRHQEPHIVSFCIAGAGYKKVRLWKNNKQHNLYIHRLVAISFVPNEHEYPEVDHIDCDKLNNEMSNLRWCTRTMNQNNPITRMRVEGSPNMKIFSLPIKMSFFWLNEYFISIKLREGRSGFNYFA